MIGVRQPRVVLAAALLVSTLLVLGACSTTTTTPTSRGNTPTATPSAAIAAVNATSPIAQPTTGIPPEPPALPTTPTTTVPQSGPTRVAARGVTPGATPVRSASASHQGIIRFSAYPTNAAEAAIAAIRPDGTGRGTFSAFPGHPWGPRASPDGTLILYSSAAPATVGRASDLDLNGTGSPDLWIANADGSQARRLAEGAAGYNGWSWSPDGRWIAFASNRGGSWDIYKIQVTGAELTRLTTSPSQDGWPVWTPDGTGIVFAATRSDRAQIYRMTATGGAVQRLLTSPTTDTESAIAPDGRIAFSAQRTDGTGEIYVLDNGSAARPLTNTGGLKSAPSWSPDGTRLAFTWQRDGRSDLFVLNADGSGLLGLTTTGQNQRPDGGRAPVDEFGVVMQQLVARAESQRRTGALEATDDDRQGTRSVTQLQFDLGDQATPPRIHRTTTTQGPHGTVTEEQIVIGDRAWQRQAGGRWATIPSQAASAEQVTHYFPRIADAQQPTADLGGLTVELSWDEPYTDTGVMLTAGIVDGLPIRLQRIDHRTGATTNVVYDWRTPITITSPTTP